MPRSVLRSPSLHAKKLERDDSSSLPSLIPDSLRRGTPRWEPHASCGRSRIQTGNEDAHSLSGNEGSSGPLPPSNWSFLKKVIESNWPMRNRLLFQMAVKYFDSQASKEIQFLTQSSLWPSSDHQNNTPNVSPVNAAPASTSNNKPRIIPLAEIELVKNLIERCLQLYMNRDEMMYTLKCRAKIDPGVTSAVLAELEEKNPNFFEAYHVRLKLKRQIVVFNQLLEHQYQLMECASPMVPLASMQNRIYDLPVNSLHIRYPILQQPLIQPPVHPQNDFLGGGSGRHMINGVSDRSNFCPMQIESVNRMMMDRIATDTSPPLPTGSVKSDIAMSPVSLASGGHFQFSSNLSSDASALEFQYPFWGFGSEWPLPDDRTGNHLDFHNHASLVPWTSSFSDLTAIFSNVGDKAEFGNYTQSPFLQAGPDGLLNSEVHNDVDTYIVNSNPGPATYPQEKH